METEFYGAKARRKHTKPALLAVAATILIATAILIASAAGAAAPTADDPSPPAAVVKLVFIHHSTGENWLADDNGGLGIALRDNHYFVSDTNYGWGPQGIGDTTDIGHWWNWFAGPDRNTYTAALYAESEQHASYSRLDVDPGGSNQVVLFKSCFPNSQLGGSPNEPPTAGANPLRGQDAWSEHHSVGNAKGIYNDLLAYFATRQDKLFVAITAPPLVTGATDAGAAANARAFNNWLVNDWLSNYPHKNVAVFDFYNVLTSNGGTTTTNDLGLMAGNHHRWWGGAVQHVRGAGNNYSSYATDAEDSHPTAAGGQKASGEFVQLLNVFYHRWQGTGETPTATVTGAVSSTPTRTPTTNPRTPTPTFAPEGWTYLPILLAGWPAPTPNPTPTPTRESQASLCPGPQPALISDHQVRQPPALAEPAARIPFRDPVFGTCLVRVTDRAADIAPDDPSAGLKNEYSRVQSFNAGESLILVRGLAATWYLYDAATLQPRGLLPFAGTVDPRWDAADPDVLYYSESTLLNAYDVRSHETALVHDFAADFPGQSLAAVWTRYEGSPSRDGRFWGLMAVNQDWRPAAFLVYDMQAGQVIATRDLRGLSDVKREIDWVTISPLGNYFMASFDDPCAAPGSGTAAAPCGLMAYDRGLQNGRSLLRIAGHADLALDAQGREVFVYQDVDTDQIAMVDLASGAVTPLWPIDFSHTSLGLHFSGRALNRPGWALISTHDGDAASHAWMDDQVFVVELKPGGRVLRLAHTHSLVDEAQEHDYWAEPHATANRDMTRVLFTTNWGRSGTEQVEMFMIELPPSWWLGLAAAARQAATTGVE